jgi:hypothetical protein
MILEEECVKVIKTFKNQKSLSTDGLPIEFYNIFWNNNKDLTLDSFS